MTVVRISRSFRILHNVFIIDIYKIVKHLLNMQFNNTFYIRGL